MFNFKKRVRQAKAFWKQAIWKATTMMTMISSQVAGMMTISSGSNDLIACGSQEFGYEDPCA